MTHLLHHRPRVVICGGGVGALEAVLALRHHLGRLVAIELVAPEAEFVYRPLTIAEPFGYARALRVPLSRVCRETGVVQHRDTLAAVHTAAREIELGDGDRLGYDALLVAIGARPENWLAGALCFTGPHAVPRIRDLLEQLATGEISSVAFAASHASWTLPLYELALLTAAWCADHGVLEVELSVITPEQRPLAAFGAAASQAVRDLLGDRGIHFVPGTQLATATEAGADAVVVLPDPRRTPISGLPATADGFIPVDEHARVQGVPHVFAAGDVTDQPIKQGGLATQQADAAAAMIAAELGAAVEPEPFEPVLRGMLIGGMSAAFLRRDNLGDAYASFDALWWPPAKVAGRHLGPYLADVAHVGEPDELVDRPARPGTAERDRQALRDVAEALADAEERWGDERDAARWRQAADWLR